MIIFVITIKSTGKSLLKPNLLKTQVLSEMRTVFSPANVQFIIEVTYVNQRLPHPFICPAIKTYFWSQIAVFQVVGYIC